MSIWVRNFFTLAVSRDLYEGVPAIYVNYLGYDETAHRYGPRSDRAMQVLHEVDQSIEPLWAVMGRVPSTGTMPTSWPIMVNRLASPTAT